MREYNEYVEDKFKEWNNKFEIPYGYEFQLKTMFELEEQFRETPKENVKTKRDILDMINRIYYSMYRLKEKKIIFTEIPCRQCLFFDRNIKYAPGTELMCNKPLINELIYSCNKDNNYKYYISNLIYNK